MSGEHTADPRSLAAFSCLPHLLEYQAQRIPDAPAILGPGRAPLTYRRLHRHADKIGRVLRARGVAGAQANGRFLAIDGDMVERGSASNRAMSQVIRSSGRLASSEMPQLAAASTMAAAAASCLACSSACWSMDRPSLRGGTIMKHHPW